MNFDGRGVGVLADFRLMSTSCQAANLSTFSFGKRHSSWSSEQLLRTCDEAHATMCASRYTKVANNKQDSEHK